MRKINIISALVLLAIAGYVVYVANGLPAEHGTLGPGFFPKLVAGLLAAFAMAILFLAVTSKKQQAAPPAPQRSLVALFVSMGLYIILLPILGFLVMTPVFLVVGGLLLADDIKQWWKKVCISAVVCTGGLYYLFGVLLNVPLP